MGSMLQPRALTRQPVQSEGLANGPVRRPCAAFVATATGLRILGDGKHDLFGKATGTSIVPAVGPNGYTAKTLSASTDSIRLNAVANQTDTVWERPHAQVTVMLVFRRFGNPAGVSPLFGNQCPNNQPFTAWCLEDQASGFARFEVAVTAAGNPAGISSSVLLPNSQLIVLIGRYDGATMDLWQNGVKVGSAAVSGAIVYPSAADRGPSVSGYYNYTGSNRSAQVETYGGALWDTAVSDSEIAMLSANPWQTYQNSSPLASATLAALVAKPAAGGATNTAVVPGAAALALTGYAPTVTASANLSATPSAGALAISGYAPVVTRGTTTSVAPAAASVGLTGYVPIVTQVLTTTVAPGSESIALSGYTPAVVQTANRSSSPAAGGVPITGYAPTVARGAVQVASLALSGTALTGYAPTILQQGPVITASVRFDILPRNFNLKTIHFSN